MGKIYDGVYCIIFIIDEEGKIEKVFKKVKIKVYMEQILEEMEG